MKHTFSASRAENRPALAARGLRSLRDLEPANPHVSDFVPPSSVTALLSMSTISLFDIAVFISGRLYIKT